MILSSLERESSRKENELGSGAAKTPKHLGKPNVIAYGASDLHPIQVEGYDGIAGNIVLTLAITSAIRSDHVKEVYFSVTCDFGALRIEHQSGIGQLATQLLTDGATVHVYSIPASDIAEERVCRTSLISRPRFRQVFTISQTDLHAAA